MRKEYRNAVPPVKQKIQLLTKNNELIPEGLAESDALLAALRGTEGARPRDPSLRGTRRPW